MNEMFKLKLHDEITFTDGMKILRVPGGWIYTLINEVEDKIAEFDNDNLKGKSITSKKPTSVFVPFGGEFGLEEEGEEETIE